MEMNLETYLNLKYKSKSQEKYVFHPKLPTLKEIASNQFAIWTLLEYISSQKKVRYENISGNDYLVNAFGLVHDDYMDDLNKLMSAERLKISPAIEKILKMRLCKSIRDEVNSCVKHFRHGLPPSLLETKRFRPFYIDRFDPNCFVWAANGTIMMKETAVKMLSMPWLSEVQKFMIMSTYCMEDEIKTISLHSLPRDFLEEVQFEEEPLLYYWLCRLRNELHKIPTNDSESLDFRMISRHGVYCKPSDAAFVYFWNRLESKEQILSTFHMLCFNWGPDEQDRVLSMLSAQQQRFYLFFRFDKIPTVLFDLSRITNATLWAWNQTKDHLGMDDFAKLIVEMVQRSRDEEEKMSILLQIWDTVDEEWKNHVLQYNANDIASLFKTPIERYSLKYKPYETAADWGSPSPSAFKFYMEFLSLKGSDVKKATILENAPIVGVAIDNIDTLNEILNSCHFTPDELKLFKKSAFDSQYLQFQCEKLFNEGHFKTLNVKLKYLSTSEEEIRNYKEKLLKSDDLNKRRFVRNVNEWVKLCEFIDESFVGNPSLATSLKKRFVSLFVTDFTCYFDFKEGESIDDLIKVVESLYTTEEELLETKRQISKAFREEIMKCEYFWKDFVEGSFLKLVRWCYGEADDVDRGVTELKSNFPIDEVFRDWVRRLLLQGWWEKISYYSEEHIDHDDQIGLTALRKCLKWYFPNAEDVKAYKLTKLYSPEGDVDIFNSYGPESDDLCLEIILRWFCHGDEEEMKKFRMSKVTRKSE